MPFKIAQQPTFKAKVTVVVPGNNDKGTPEKSEFVAEFKRVDVDELNDLTNEPNRDVMRTMLVGWKGLIDDAGNEVEFSSATVDALLRIPHAVKALIESFWSNATGAIAKN